MSGESILIVDDNRINLKLAEVLLAAEGYQVRTAGDGEEALEMLNTFHPSLILMDIQMPGMDGLTLTRLIKAEPRTCGITVVALTAYAMKGDDEKAIASGCSGYISKPIDTRRFAAEVSHYLTVVSPTVD
jgi:CheY-like chemotaxis protein